MTIVIQIYILICISLLVFDVCFLLLKNRRTDIFFPHNINLEKNIESEILVHKNQGKFSEGFAMRLSEKLRETQNMITLITVLDTYPEYKNLFKPFVLEKIEDYQKKTDYEQAYYTYVVSYFDYEEKDITGSFNAKFFEFLDSKSLYTFINAMEAYYKFGDEDLLLKALDKVEERQGFYNHKLLVDGLLSSKVNFKTFNQKLLQNFDKYSDFTKVALLDYFRYNGEEVSELCLKLMHTPSTDLEVRYSALRYFTKFKNEKARRYCMDILNQEKYGWIDQMLAIQILEKFKNPDVYQTVKNKIYSPNWYVRLNAANYLYKYNITKAELFDILNHKDKYANEILLYQCREDEELTQFISNTIEILESEENKGEEHA